MCFGCLCVCACEWWNSPWGKVYIQSHFTDFCQVILVSESKPREFYIDILWESTPYRCLQYRNINCLFSFTYLCPKVVNHKQKRNEKEEKRIEISRSKCEPFENEVKLFGTLRFKTKSKRNKWLEDEEKMPLF